jgi:hypothetical protein
MRLMVLIVPLLVRNAAAHEIINHQTIMDYAGQKAAALPTPLIFNATQTSRMHEGAADEDSGTRPLNHAYNPMTGATFPLGAMNARDAAAIRWNSMSNAFFVGNLDGGDDVGAWHFLGRTSHLLQDMTSPLHSLAIEHLEPVCQFEKYWQTNDLSLRTALTSIGGPLQSSTLDPKAIERLDAFTTARLQDRFNNSSPNKNNDDPRGWLEVMVWITYFRSTFWGEVTMSSSIGNGTATASSTAPTTFSDGAVGLQANTLQTMFGSGNVRWINNFIGDDYYEITDRNGNVFRFMSFTDVDDWAACGEAPSHDGWSYGQKDSSIRVNGSDDDDDAVRVTGRFWFDLRELGRSTSGSFNRYCYPPFYPNGNSMTEHLIQYLGNTLDPLAVRYNAGLLGLANRRVTVQTADETPANGFSWSRKDNFGNPNNAAAAFNTGSEGSNFFFVAKSEAALTAPATNSAGRRFVRWLQDGAGFSGNTNRMIAINTTIAPIPTTGRLYAAEYEAPQPAITGTSIGNGTFHFVLNGQAGSNYAIQVSSNLVNWSVLQTNSVPASGFRVIDIPIQTNQAKLFYRALLVLQTSVSGFEFRFEFSDALSQRLNDFFDFGGGIARRDIFGAVPIEREDVDEDEALDDAPGLRLGQLRDEFGMLAGVLHAGVAENFQALAIWIIHEKEGHAIVGGQVAGGKHLAISPVVGERELGRVEHTEKSGLTATMLDIGPAVL